MGLFDKILGNKNIIKQAEALMGNADIMGTLKSLTGNKEFMTKLASAKNENELQHLVTTAVDAMKDKKLTDAEKAELTKQLKSLAGGIMGKK